MDKWYKAILILFAVVVLALASTPFIRCYNQPRYDVAPYEGKSINGQTVFFKEYRAYDSLTVVANGYWKLDWWGYRWIGEDASIAIGTTKYNSRRD